MDGRAVGPAPGHSEPTGAVHFVVAARRAPDHDLGRSGQFGCGDVLGLGVTTVGRDARVAEAFLGDGHGKD